MARTMIKITTMMMNKMKSPKNTQKTIGPAAVNDPLEIVTSNPNPFS